MFASTDNYAIKDQLTSIWMYSCPNLLSKRHFTYRQSYVKLLLQYSKSHASCFIWFVTQSFSQNIYIYIYIYIYINIYIYIIIAPFVIVKNAILLKKKSIHCQELQSHVGKVKIMSMSVGMLPTSKD